MNFNSFILNEEIIANGKSLDTDEDKKNQSNYTSDTADTEDKPDDKAPDTTEPPKEDPAPAATPDTTEPEPAADTTDDDQGTDYTVDKPDAEEDDVETPDAGLDNTEDDQATDYTADTPDEEDGREDTGAEPAADTEDDDQGTDYTADSPDGEEGDGGEAGADGDGTGGEDNTEDDDQGTDYTADSPDGEEGDGGEAGNEVDDGATDAQPSSGPDEEIKQLETDLFSNMTPEQVAIKQLELKQNFITLYTNIEKVIERLSKINRVEDNIKPIEFVARRLLELKALVRDSLVESYDTRSYIENQIILQRHMAIFSTLSNILDELSKEKK